MFRAKRIAKRTGIVVLGLALGVTGCSAVYNVATSPDEHSGRSLAPSGQFVDAGGVLTHYERFGARGPAIVLVGGFLEPSDTWDAVARELGRHHRVFAMDLAGFGYSERSGHYLLADWQRQLDDFMRAVGVPHALLARHSLAPASSPPKHSPTRAEPTESCWSTATPWRAAAGRECCAT